MTSEHELDQTFNKIKNVIKLSPTNKRPVRKHTKPIKFKYYVNC